MAGSSSTCRGSVRDLATNIHFLGVIHYRPSMMSQGKTPGKDPLGGFTGGLRGLSR